MFKRNLTTDAFDAISFDKEEISPPIKVHSLSDQDRLLRYGLIAFCGILLLISFLVVMLYLDNKEKFNALQREHELHKIEFNLLKNEVKEKSLTVESIEVKHDDQHPAISYWGTIKTEGKTKALIGLNGVRQLVSINHVFELGWHISELFDEYLIIKSDSGNSVQINREESGL